MIVLILIAWVSWRYSGQELSGYHYLAGLILKWSAGIAIGIVYFYFYRDGDTLVFHEASDRIVCGIGTSVSRWSGFLFRNDLSFLHGHVPEIVREPRSLFFIKIVSVLYLLTDSNYWVAGLYLSFLSFLGSWFLCREIIRIWPDMRQAAIISLLYFPTLVFWSSGILKESIAWPCIALLSTLFLRVHQRGKPNVMHLLAGLFLISVLWSIKYHYAAVWILCATGSILIWTLRNKLRRAYSGLFFLAALFIVGLALTFVHPNFRLTRLAGVIASNHDKILAVSDPGNCISFIETGNRYIDIAVNIPVSLFGGLFLPFPWQGNNWLIRLVGLMNLLIFVLFIARLRNIKKDRIAIVDKWTGVFFYVVILAILMAYTTPNFGTLERYKISYMPFFLIWIIYANPLINKIRFWIFN